VPSGTLLHERGGDTPSPSQGIPERDGSVCRECIGGEDQSGLAWFFDGWGWLGGAPYQEEGGGEEGEEDADVNGAEGWHDWGLDEARV